VLAFKGAEAMERRNLLAGEECVNPVALEAGGVSCIGGVNAAVGEDTAERNQMALALEARVERCGRERVGARSKEVAREGEVAFEECDPK
jgi:hypothetical protein